MPHTSQARPKAAVAAAIADFHGTTRSHARSNARINGGNEATSADRNTLPATGLYT